MVQKGFHCAYDSHYHIVFPVKYRKALLDPMVTQTIKETVMQICLRYEIEMEQIGCDLDHIHLLLSFHPKYSGGKIVQIIKSITAKQLFKIYPNLKSELWGGEFWSDGYYLSTIGTGGSWKTVESYIRNQGKKPEDVQLKLL